MSLNLLIFVLLSRRTSHEVRGLKYTLDIHRTDAVPSHLTRGAWIEIRKSDPDYEKCPGRTSHEVRGLKYNIYAHRIPRL